LRIIAAIFALFMAGAAPAYADYVAPTANEQSLFDKLREDLENIDTPKYDVSGVLGSFDEPVTIQIPCGTGDANSDVSVTIGTRLAKFDTTLAHKGGAITGGIYTWKCAITFSGGHLDIKCDNELMLNHDAIKSSAEKDQRIRDAEGLVILYHELLHGQLMMDAIQSSESWRNDTCKKKHGEKLDYSHTDADHNIITPLQAEFAERLITERGGMMQVETITPEETSSGGFAKKVGSLHDYPNSRNGINVSARSYNISTLQISSQNTDIMVTGTLSNATAPGAIWLYVFAKEPAPQPVPEDTSKIAPVPATTSIPSWIKNNARWWAGGTIPDRDFVAGMQYLVQSGIITIPPTQQVHSGSSDVPHWVKSNAKWWADGLIPDLEFVSGIQYMIKSGIMRVQVSQSSIQGLQEITQSAPQSGPAPVQRQFFVMASQDVIEKKPYGSSQTQITGRVENFKSGTSVTVHVTGPGGKTLELQGMVTNKGMFTIPIMMDKNYDSGPYDIAAYYNGRQIGTASFLLR